MNRTELIEKIAEKTSLSKKDVDVTVKAFVETITEALIAGDKIPLVGFGTFETVNKPARTGRNPITGETVDIAAKTTPKFKPGKTLKDAVNK